MFFVMKAPNTYNEGSKLGDGSIKYETIKMTCKYSLGIVYVIYLCYVLSTVSTAKNFYRIYRQKTKILWCIFRLKLCFFWK